MKGRTVIAGSHEGAMLERIVEILLEEGFTQAQIAAETGDIAERHRVKESMMSMLKNMGPKKLNERGAARTGHSSDIIERDPVSTSDPEETGTAQTPRPMVEETEEA